MSYAPQQANVTQDYQNYLIHGEQDVKNTISSPKSGIEFRTSRDLGELDPDVRLKHPISIIIEGDENGFVGLFPPLGIYTLYQSSIHQAIGEVRAEILDLFDYLKETPDSNLGPILKNQKKYLKRIIAKCFDASSV